MPDAFIPSLAEFGLDRVPGHRVDPLTGAEDPTWRQEWFDWRDKVRAHRLAVQERCASDLQFRADHLALCRNDPAYFVTMWLVVEEPRGEDRSDDEDADDADYDEDAPWELVEEPTDSDAILEFIPFAYQVEIIQLFAKVNGDPRRCDVYIDKARGIGVSYVILAAAYWAFLFRTWRGIFLSDKLERADRSFDLSSMFGKIDLFFFYTPNWMRPKGWNSKSQKHRQQGMFKNPENRIGQLTAVATTPSAGRGDRARYSASDESAFQEFFEDTHATLEGTVRHRWAWSSDSRIKGRQWANAVDAAKAHMRRRREEGRRPLAIVIELDWWLNPYQDRRWYDETLERFIASGKESAFRVEYLRDGDAAYEGTQIYPEVRRCPDTTEGFDPTKMLNVGIDPGIKDETAIVFWQTHFKDGHKTVRWLDSYVNSKMPAEFYAHLMTGIMPKEGDLLWHLADRFGEKERYFMRWLGGVRPTMLWVCGDPAMAATGGGGYLYQHKENSFLARFMTHSRELREAHAIEPAWPIDVHIRELYKRNRHMDRRTAMHEALVYSEFSLTEGAQELKEAIGSVRLQEMTEKTTTPPGWIHDQFTHRTSAGEFGMTYETLKMTAQDVEPVTMSKVGRLKGSAPSPRSRYRRDSRSDVYRPMPGASKPAHSLLEIA